MRFLFNLNQKLWRRLPTGIRNRFMGLLEYHLPSSLFQKILGAVGSGVYRQEVLKTGILFIHIPKAAGTSVNRAIYGLGGIGHYRALYAQALNPVLFNKLYSFAVTRNPWERLLSSYKFAKAGGTAEVPLNSASTLQSELPDTFESFVLDWLIKQNPQKVDTLFVPQYLFVYDEKGNLLVNEVFDLKSFSKLEIVLSQRLGREIQFPHDNMTGSNQSLLDAYSNSKVIKAVTNFYIRDVELFGYEFPQLEVCHR